MPPDSFLTIPLMVSAAYIFPLSSAESIIAKMNGVEPVTSVQTPPDCFLIRSLSATYRFPSESTVTAVGLLNPAVLAMSTQRSSTSIFKEVKLSVTYTFPFLSTATSDGRIKPDGSRLVQAPPESIVIEGPFASRTYKFPLVSIAISLNLPSLPSRPLICVHTLSSSFFTVLFPASTTCRIPLSSMTSPPRPEKPPELVISVQPCVTGSALTATAATLLAALTV